MPGNTHPRRARLSSLLPLSVAAIYIIVALLWIYYSDLLLARFQTIKGTGFVLVTGLLLYGTLEYFVRSVNRRQELIDRSRATMLAALEARSRVLNALPAQIALLDDHGRIITTNDNWNLFDSGDRIVGSSFPTDADYVDLLQARQTAHHRQVADGVAAVLQNRQPEFVFEYPVEHDGATRHFALTAVGLGTPARGVALMHTDVTEQKRARALLEQAQVELEKRVAQRTADLERAVDQLHREIEERTLIEQQLRVARHDAERANRAKSALLANTGHEIRTPLTNIVGYLELLRGSTELAPDQRDSFLQIVYDNVAHMLSLVEDILDLGRVEADRLNIRLEDVDPRALVQQVAQMVRPRLEQKGLGLLVDCDEATPERIRLGPARVRQILLNLLDNAAKFTPAGSITLQLRSVGDPFAPGQCLVCFAVSDTGPGLDPEQQEAVFEPFHQVSPDGSRTAGAGLGLTISLKLARQMGGTINVFSCAGQGSTFTLQLPLVHPDGSSQLADLPALRGRVLLAEDNANIRQLVGLLLESAGAQVQAVPDGASAVDAMHDALDLRRHFDLVLLDMQMPGIDGPHATARLRDAGYAGPIVALTASTRDEDRQRWLAAGCNDVLAKPLDRDRFTALLSTYLHPPEPHTP